MKFLYFTSGITWRVPINPDGSPGSPEILKKWSNETFAKKKPKPKPTPQATVKEIEEGFR